MGTASRMSKAVVKSAAVLLLSMQAVVCARAESIQDIRFWSAGELTRVTIETESEVKFKFGSLDRPDRFFIDLKSVEPGSGKKTIAIGDGLVSQIRVGRKEASVTRVVLDLQSKASVSVNQLSNPNRLVFELKRAGGKPIVSRVEPPLQPPPVVAKVRAVKGFQMPRLRGPAPNAALMLQAPPLVSAAVVLPAFYAARFPLKVALPMELSRAAARTVEASHLSFPTLRLSPPPKIQTVAASLPARYALRFPPKVKPPAKFVPEPEERPMTAPAVPATVTVAKVAPAPAPVRGVPPSNPPESQLARLAQPAERTSAGTRSLTRALGLKLERVVLDAGHGGHDTGTISASGLLEKDLVLDVTLRLGKLIEDRLGAEVVYTRDDDTFIPLRRRTEIANERRADLFLSVHANSSSARSIAGTETYFLNFSNSKEDMDVASRENAGSEQSIHDLSDLVRKIALQAKVEESREFAERIQSATYELSTSTVGRVKNRGVKKAPFVVLIGAEMPSVLSEIGFITNAKEEALMKKPEYRQKIAEALLKGITKYADSLSHFAVAARGTETTKGE